MSKTLKIGKGKPGPGRPKGVPNRMTATAKEAFQIAFEDLGGAEAMVLWAASDPDNLKTFYTLYARLIPVDIQAKVNDVIVRHEWGK
mgnify:CR=1 FL=1